MSDRALVELFELILFAVLLLAFVPVVIGTIRRRGRWGINMKPIHCPQCGEPAPKIRKPKNLNQAMWGGVTCTKCGQEYGKWGQPVASSP
jgi:hypothetical protein